MTKIDPRNGAPKKPTPITPHPGMRFVERLPDGSKATAVGFTKTNFAHPIDDELMIHKPTVEKQLAPVETKSGMRSRIAPGGIDKSARLPGKCC
jgi:hypothetical protein